MTDSNGFLKRSDRGRFATGTDPGPGRPKGKPNRATIDARELRSRVIESWERVNGDEKLDQLAKSDFPAYLRTVAGLLPRNDPTPGYEEWRQRTEAAIAEYAGHVGHRALDFAFGFLAAIPADYIAEFLQRLVPAEKRMTEDEATDFFVSAFGDDANTLNDGDTGSDIWTGRNENRR